MNSEANLHVRELVLDTLREWAAESELPHAAPLAAVARVALQMIRDPTCKGAEMQTNIPYL